MRPLLLLLLVSPRLARVRLVVTSEVREPANTTCGFADESEGWLNEQPIEFFDNNNNNIGDNDNDAFR